MRHDLRPYEEPATELLLPRQGPRPQEELHLRSVWGVMRRHQLLVAGCVILGVSGAAVGNSLVTPLYEASTSIRVEEKQGTLPEVFRTLSTGGQVVTEMEVLRSRTLAHDVVDSLHLRLTVLEPKRVRRAAIFARVGVAPEADTGQHVLVRRSDGRFAVLADGAEAAVVAPGERAEVRGVSFTLAPGARDHARIAFHVAPLDDAVDLLADEVRVGRSNSQANILTVRYRHTDPQIARDVPNVWAARFIARRQNAQKTEARSTATFLRAQIDTLAGELASAEDKLRRFREQQKVVDPETEATTQVSRLAATEAERGGLEAERQALAQLLAEMRSAEAQRPDDASPYRNLIAFPTLLRNQATSELLRSLTAVEDQRATLLTRRTPQDPDVLALTARSRELEEQLRGIAVTYLQGLSNQVAALERNLARYGHQLGRIPAREVQFARLQREPKLLAEMSTLLKTRLKEAQIAQAVEDPSIQVVDRAVTPKRPVRPKPAFNLALGLLVGMLLGTAATFAREYTDNSVHTRAELQWATGAPVIGLIPTMATRSSALALLRPLIRGAGHMPVAPTGADSPAAVAEAYARLQTNIAFIRSGTAAETILFTSPLSGDGKTTNATNFAAALAGRGRKVILVDGDLRRGVISNLFTAPRAPGLAEVLGGSVTLPDAVRSVTLSGGGVLHYLTTGSHPPNPAVLLESEAMRTLLEQLKRDYETVVIDSPPLNVVTDAAVLGAMVDGVIVVARVGVTAVEALGYTMEQLRNARAPVLGAVLNDIDFKRDSAYDGSYRYYGHGDPYYTTPAR